jgi:hypothetical protein
MSVRDDLTAALNGETPQRTPLSIYHFFMRPEDAADWEPILEMGLGVNRGIYPLERIEHGVETQRETVEKNGHRYDILRKVTPVGTVQRVAMDGWHHEDWIKEPADYRVFRWIAEQTELRPAYERFAAAEAEVGERGLVNLQGSRTPAMVINVDIAGTERFCLDVAMEVPELFDLYHAMRRLFVEETRLIAACPGGRFVKWLENLTISMLGPDRYRDLLLSVYRECAPLLSEAGKRVMVHYDGALRVIADQIAAAPFHIIESLTEPPEGDMTYDECRAAWPEKAFWANLNVDLYALPPERLREEVAARRERAGKRGLAFEISEDLPANWRQSVPVVLETLAELE